MLLPEPAEATVDELYGVARPRPADRPWVGVVMITSLDGSTAVAGRSGGLGNATDAAILGALRRAADVVIVGAGTARAEGYGAPRQAGLRIGVVTSSGRVDPASELFTSGAGFLVAPVDGPSLPAGIDVVRAGRGEVDLGLAVRRLGDVIDDPGLVQAEGGPQLNGRLLASGCVDELDLTLAPAIVGGAGSRAFVGAPEALACYDLAHLGTDGGYLYGRWVRPA